MFSGFFFAKRRRMTKNTSYHYSIIIPHKNTPRLLERCLCSIPTWDEIQIIIIDDNSNSESVDFSHFPGNGRKNTEVLFTKEGKGAGYARNIGLSHARGKWIIFADADDFFTADCFTILNEYMDSPHEVIYFNVRFVMSDNPSQESRRGTYYTNFFNDVNPENKLRYQSQVPWGKMIRKHCREFRPMEVLYELNLFYPFSLLLNWGIYRHHILYKYANLIKLYYKIWGRLYR